MEDKEKKSTKKAAAPTGENVTITPELMSVIDGIVESRLKSAKSSDSSNDPVSVYGFRDPKSIETVNVKRIFGKFVIGFKNIQNDPLKSHIPKYISYQLDPIRKLANQPYLTLILSSGDGDIEEKDILLSDYYNERESFKANIVETKENTKIVSTGLLGRGGEFAREVDDKGAPVQRSAIKAEVELKSKVFLVELPGFAEPVEFNDDPMGPLA